MGFISVNDEFVGRITEDDAIQLFHSDVTACIKQAFSILIGNVHCPGRFSNMDRVDLTVERRKQTGSH